MLLVKRTILLNFLCLFGIFFCISEAETLEKKLNDIDKLRTGFDTNVEEAERRCNELLKEYTDPNDHGKIYFELVQVEGQSGFQRPAKILEFINKALECPQEPLKKTRLYIYWGDALQIANRGVHNQELIVARREAAMPYLLGLKEILKDNLPEKKPDVPTGTLYNYSYNPNDPNSKRFIESMRKKQEEQWEAQKRLVFSET